MCPYNEVLHTRSTHPNTNGPYCVKAMQLRIHSSISAQTMLAATQDAPSWALQQRLPPYCSPPNRIQCRLHRADTPFICIHPYAAKSPVAAQPARQDVHTRCKQCGLAQKEQGHSCHTSLCDAHVKSCLHTLVAHAFCAGSHHQ